MEREKRERIGGRFMRILSLVSVSFIFMFILSAEAASQDKVQLGLVGHWSNNYGNFNAVEVMKGEECCD